MSDFAFMARTIEALEARGYTVGIVERDIRAGRRMITRDFIGCIDLSAFQPPDDRLLVQVTEGSNHSKRRDKILAEPRALRALQSGYRIVCASWARRGAVAKGNRLPSWTLREQEITLAHFLTHPDVVIRGDEWVMESPPAQTRHVVEHEDGYRELVTTRDASERRG